MQSNVSVKSAKVLVAVVTLLAALYGWQQQSHAAYSLPIFEECQRNLNTTLIEVKMT